MYDETKLLLLARDMLRQARINLRKCGCLSHVVLVFGSSGLMFAKLLSWRNLKDKRRVQSGIKRYLIDSHAQAAVVITESWVKLDVTAPIDLSKSIKHLPGREEAIVIEARSAFGGVCLIQPFIKGNTGAITFKEVLEFSGSNYHGFSEFLDGVWTHRLETGYEVVLQ